MYPADCTPGHLLSVVPNTQLALLRQREAMQKAASKTQPAPKKPKVRTPAPPPVITAKPELETKPQEPKSPAKTNTPKPYTFKNPAPPPPVLIAPRGGLNPMPPAMIMPQRVNSSLEQRYREAIKAQQEWLRRLQGR